MEREYERLLSCLEAVRAKVDFQPKVGLVLGSGLGDYGKSIELKYVLDY